MKITVCDLCGQRINFFNKYAYRIKIKDFFYPSETKVFDRKTIDICSNCINNFKEYIKEKNEKLQ